MYRGRTILQRVLNDKWPSVDWLMSRLDWLIRLRSVGFSSEGLVRYRKVTLAGVAVVSSLRALIIQTYRVPSISVLHRGRGCELRDDVGGSKSPGMHYSQFHIEIARGAHRCLREEMETHFISRLGDSPSKPRHVTDGLVSTYKSTWRFAGRYRKASLRERTQNLTRVESNTNHHNSIDCVIDTSWYIYFVILVHFTSTGKYVVANRNLMYINSIRYAISLHA